eukprot:CAMPEP_0197565428 /NCGR_PEP_ID=MMETSP1320-20131121/32134_1 /TAXON_ID=91990 /ORGANISM="Bolidomonas sp., Strain RCC2347" /LENGTH=127 /DNA_ID=CAMNT_0043127423 /DNA_START=18 /DNA_END=399 /DNA_ORIENTATION=-
MPPPPKSLSPASPSTSAAAAAAYRYKKVGDRSRRSGLNVNKANAKRADRLLAQLENLSEDVCRIYDQVGKVKKPKKKSNDWDRLLLGKAGKGGERKLEEIKIEPELAVKIVSVASRREENEVEFDEG